MKDINFTNKRILVTGGTGFIGGRLVEKLVLDYNATVRVLIRNFAKAAHIARLPIEMVKGDVRNASDVSKAVKGCDIVFHCAYGNNGDATTQRCVNVEGTRNIMKASLENSVQRVVHVSTVQVYGDVPDGYLNETFPYQYSGEVYSDTKLYAEKIVKYFLKQGLPAVIIQPTIVYGPWAPIWTVSILDKLKKARVVMDESEGLCNAVYVDDVVNALLLAAIEKNAIGETFIVSGDKPVQWKEFYAAYETMLNVKSIILMSQKEIDKYRSQQKTSRSLINQMLNVIRGTETTKRLMKIMTFKFAWKTIKKLITGEEPKTNHLTSINNRPLLVLNESILSLLRKKLYFRIDKAKKMLGYRPAFDLKRGMELTQQWAKWANLL